MTTIFPFSRILILAAVTTLLGCHPSVNEESKGDGKVEGTGTFSFKDLPSSVADKMLFQIKLRDRDEYPIDTISDMDIIRLHHDPSFSNAYTYAIKRVPRRTFPHGLLHRPVGHEFILYTKMYDNYVSDYVRYTTSVKRIPEELEDSKSPWAQLLALIDSSEVLHVHDSRFKKSYGLNNLFVLEMNVGGIYQEIYFKPDPPLEPHVFIPIHEAFQRLCPAPLPLE